MASRKEIEVFPITNEPYTRDRIIRRLVFIRKRRQRLIRHMVGCIATSGVGIILILIGTYNVSMPDTWAKLSAVGLVLVAAGVFGFLRTPV